MSTNLQITQTSESTWLFQPCSLRESLDRGVGLEWKKLDVFMWLARTTQNAAWDPILELGGTNERRK